MPSVDEGEDAKSRDCCEARELRRTDALLTGRVAVKRNAAYAVHRLRNRRLFSRFKIEPRKFKLPVTRVTKHYRNIEARRDAAEPYS